MIFYLASIFESGHIVEQDQFDSATFDRSAVAQYRSLIDKGEDFGEDLGEVHLEFTTTGPKSAIIEMSSDKGDVVMHLLGNTDPDAAMKELANVFTTIHDPQEPVGEVFQLKARPLALALLADASPAVRGLSRYPIALAAAFFEAKSSS
jgi:hypothetical protein